MVLKVKSAIRRCGKKWLSYQTTHIKD
jgi:hypothetical protein